LAGRRRVWVIRAVIGWRRINVAATEAALDGEMIEQVSDTTRFEAYRLLISRYFDNDADVPTGELG
jgi:hypothetical protein